MSDQDSPPPAPHALAGAKQRCLPRRLVSTIRGLLLGFAILWAVGAIHFDFPGSWITALLWLALGFGLRFAMAKSPHRDKVWPAMFLLVWLPWLAIRPSNDRDWAPEYARTTHVDVEGDVLTFHDLRNFDYALDGPGGEIRQVPGWETRRYRLSELRGVDMFINYWGSPWMAHPILSFDFGPDGHLAFSIETRRESTEGYSALAGFYKKYELSYIAGTEEDLVRVRTSFRKGEDVYLYRLRTPPDKARERLMEYVARLNQLHAKPKFYDVIRSNCTTSIRSHVAASALGAWDWRLLLNGKMDEMFFERGAFSGPAHLPLSEWKKQALINPAANASPAGESFSERIRRGRPGF